MFHTHNTQKGTATLIVQMHNEHLYHSISKELTNLEEHIEGDLYHAARVLMGPLQPYLAELFRRAPLMTEVKTPSKENWAKKVEELQHRLHNIVNTIGMHTGTHPQDPNLVDQWPK